MRQLSSILAPGPEYHTGAQTSAQQEAAWRQQRQDHVLAYVGAANTFGQTTATHLERFIVHRVAVAEAQHGGRRLRDGERAELEGEAKLIADRLGLSFAASIAACSTEDWLRCVAWVRGHQLEEALPATIERLGRPVANAVRALLVAWGLHDSEPLPGYVSATGLQAQNPLCCGRWPGPVWAEVQETRAYGDYVWQVTVPRQVAQPILAPWLSWRSTALAVDHLAIQEATT